MWFGLDAKATLIWFKSSFEAQKTYSQHESARLMFQPRSSHVPITFQCRTDLCAIGTGAPFGASKWAADTHMNSKAIA